MVVNTSVCFATLFSVRAEHSSLPTLHGMVGTAPVQNLETGRSGCREAQTIRRAFC